MKYIKKVSVTKLPSNTGTIIDSMTSGDDPHTNAPSINAVSQYIIGGKIIFTKSINVSTANTWYDTGITGNDLITGTYVMEMYIGSYSVNQQYSEHLSGVVAWYAADTNSTDADEIPLSKAGHARNSHNIKLRILRHPKTSSSDYGQKISLQISDSIRWTGAGEVQFTFRKLI